MGRINILEVFLSSGGFKDLVSYQGMVLGLQSWN